MRIAIAMLLFAVAARGQLVEPAASLAERAQHYAAMHGVTNAATLRADRLSDWTVGSDGIIRPERWAWACPAPATDAELPTPDATATWLADQREATMPAMRDLKRDIAATIDGLQTNVTVSAFPAGAQRQEFRDLADYVTDLAKEVQRLRRREAENERGK